MARFDAMVARRLAGEPLQYVLGRWGFRSLDLMVDQRVADPATRDRGRGRAGHRRARSRAPGCVDRQLLVADLGTGSGAIALSIAVECAPPGSSPPTARPTRSPSPEPTSPGSAGPPPGSRSTRARGSRRCPGSCEGSLDVIVVEPALRRRRRGTPAGRRPDWEPASALRAGPARTRRSAPRSSTTRRRWLAAEGALVLEMAPDQTGTVAGWAEEAGHVGDGAPDLGGRARAVVARQTTGVAHGGTRRPGRCGA